MIARNLEFQEEYKKLDALCKDLFSTGEGVSEYIRNMEATPFRLRAASPDWDADFRQLKHLRWIRNRLAHEVGVMDEELCTEEEIEWIRCFYRKILRTSDPLAVAHQAEKREARSADHAPKKALYPREESDERRSEGPSASGLSREEIPRKEAAKLYPEEEKSSFWSRLAKKIKEFFS